MAIPEDEVTRLLEAWNQGDPQALEKLMPLVFDDLRSIARRYFAREDPDHTLQTTALVNELYLRLAGRDSVRWKSASHFFGSAANMIRQLLVDHARHRDAAKRGGGDPRIPLPEDFPVPTGLTIEELLALDEALHRLQELNPRQAQVVELKHFSGLTIAEIAEVLGVRLTTVKADWRLAKAWLKRELGNGSDP